jgi:glycosyltransferase involved in cell wall biosynthesis
MRVSVIISTFDSPEWLDRVLVGYRHQTHAPWQVVVADDGSGAATMAVVERHRRTGLPQLVHVWHRHEGFRKCRILNRAIDRATGDYLVFTDGDCIPRADFVATHVRLARQGHALSGGCIRLSQEASLAITREAIASGACMEWPWLRRHVGRSMRSRLKMLTGGDQFGGMLDHLTPTRASFNGHNSSAWREDVIRVNGFDERMEYGGLDRELGERLMQGGVRFRHVRHRAICLHLEHPRPYVTEASWQRNREIRDATRRHRMAWTPYGIVQDETRASLSIRRAA